jgi:hypothetical protein
MSDRELLEFAAKAAGYVLQETEDGYECNFDDSRIWNPITDDGDAMRLMVKRKILRCHMDLFHRFYEEEIARGRSEADATRRAIVRAAAEIGRQMP